MNQDEEVFRIDPEQIELISPDDAAKLRQMNELADVIRRLKQGLDHEVNVQVAIPTLIENEPAMQALTERVKEARNTADRIKERYASVKQFADKLHGIICAEEKSLQLQVQAWISQASTSIAAFVQAENLRRHQKQQELQLQLEVEHQKKIEKQAKQLERSGDGRSAEQLREQSRYTRPVAYVPPVEAPPIKQAFDFEITDTDMVPRQWCAPDEKKIRNHIKNLGKDAIDSIPGVRVFPKDAKAQVRR